MHRSKSQFLELFLVKLIFNLRSEVARNYLSYLWWVLEPVLFVAVLYLVFGMFLARSVDNFVAFLVCGKIPFLWFSRSVMNANGSIWGGRGLIHQVALPKAFFPMLVVFQDLVKQGFVFTLMLVFLILYGIEPGAAWLHLPLLLLAQLLLIIACALLTALITTFVWDFKFLVSTGMMLLMFGSGVFYSYEDVLEPRYQALFLLNPLALLIKNYRQVLMENAPPDWQPILVLMLLCATAIAVLLLIYGRAENALARAVIE